MSKLIVSSSPHFKSNNSTAKIMRDVIIALIPSLIASIIFFVFLAVIVLQRVLL